MSASLVGSEMCIRDRSCLAFASVVCCVRHGMCVACMPAASCVSVHCALRAARMYVPCRTAVACKRAEGPIGQ
eukprot:14319642-Alexandrium_andersonii.AAC.1